MSPDAVQMIARHGMILIWVPTPARQTLFLISAGNVGAVRAETLQLTPLTVHVALLLHLSDAARPALFGPL